MTRCAVGVRPATPDDLPALVELWSELRELGGRGGRGTPTPVAATARARILQAVCDPSCRVVLATVDDVPAGMAILAPGSLGPLSDVRVVQVDYLVVSARHRHRGIGGAVIAAAAAYADEIGAEQVTVNVHPGLRDANRFFARLGFTPLVVRRVASVASLHRRLAPVERRPNVLRDLVRRRSQRERGVPASPV